MYKNRRTPVIFECPVHGEKKVMPPILLRKDGYGCVKCSGKYQLTKEEWFAKAKSIHGDLYSYEKTIYPPSIEDRGMVTITCKKHGDFLIRARSHVHDNYLSGCPECNNSRGETKVANFLKKLKINYVVQFNLKSNFNKRYRYDFYLPDLNILIEYDGIQHYQEVENLAAS